MEKSKPNNREILQDIRKDTKSLVNDVSKLKDEIRYIKIMLEAKAKVKQDLQSISTQTEGRPCQTEKQPEQSSGWFW